MLEILAKFFAPPTVHEQATAIGASLGVQSAVAMFRLTRDPLMSAVAGATGACFGAYLGAQKDLDRIEAELDRLRALGYNC